MIFTLSIREGYGSRYMMDKWTEGMKSPNPAGRGKGRFSPENEMKRAHDVAMRNVARAAIEGDLQASIAVLRYNQSKEM